MHPPKAFVLRTAGTNCDGETVEALARAGARAELLHLERLVAEPARLDEAALVVLPGGFSYGDDVAAGRVFGLELRHLLHDALAAFVERGGFVLGVCNGFQVLVEAGLFEPAGAPRTIALIGNASNRFECRWVTLRSEDSACPWLVASERWPVPVAHAEGRFVAADGGALERLAARRQIALRYVAPERREGGPAHYPDNPNGSLDDIAGVCDPTGRVLGLMPHPERNVTPWNHPFWTRLPARDEGEGLAFFRRMVDAAAAHRSGTPV
jgi:phosphoribosylformylglycinamidine synthase